MSHHVRPIAISLAAVALATTAGPAAAQAVRRDVAATPMNLADWAGERRLAPDLVADLTIYYCEEHFPAGSQALANLEAAVAAYDMMPGVRIALATAPAPGTTTHVPDLKFDDAVMVDYAPIDPDAWAGAFVGTCDPVGAIEECRLGRVLLNSLHYTTDTDPWDDERAPSVGVFFHELGHLLGLTHPENSTGANRALARATIHGPKVHRDDPRGAVRHALTLAHLRAVYPAKLALLPDAELSVHPVLMLADADGTTSDEITFDKRYQRNPEAGLADGLNEVKLRWNPVGRRFDACVAPTASAPPTWRAQLSETGGGLLTQAVELRWSISTAAKPAKWTRLATTTIDHAAGVEPLAQYDWTTKLVIGAAAVGLPVSGPLTMVTRQLAFEIDPDGAVTEDDETDNRVTATVCLYPAGDACSAPCE